MKLIKIITITFASLLSSYTLTMEEKESKNTFFPFENITLSIDEENNKQLGSKTYYLPNQTYAIVEKNKNILAGPYSGCRLWILYGCKNKKILGIHESYDNCNIAPLIKKYNKNTNQLYAICVQQKGTNLTTFPLPWPNGFKSNIIDPKKIVFYDYNNSKTSSKFRYAFIKNQNGIPIIYTVNPTENTLMQEKKIKITDDYHAEITWDRVCEDICSLRQSQYFSQITKSFDVESKKIIKKIIEKNIEMAKLQDSITKKITLLLEKSKKN